MAIGSQYVRGAKVTPLLPPHASGVMSITKGFTPVAISEEVAVSTTPTATVAISESVEVTAA